MTSHWLTPALPYKRCGESVHWNTRPQSTYINRKYVYLTTWKCSSPLGSCYWVMVIRLYMVYHMAYSFPRNRWGFVSRCVTWNQRSKRQYAMNWLQSTLATVERIHCRVRQYHDDVINWKNFPCNWPFVRGIHRSRWIPHTKASDAELWCLLWSASE